MNVGNCFNCRDTRKFPSSECPCVKTCAKNDSNSACPMQGCDNPNDYNIMGGRFCDRDCPMKHCLVRDRLSKTGILKKILNIFKIKKEYR